MIMPISVSFVCTGNQSFFFFFSFVNTASVKCFVLLVSVEGFHEKL